MKREKEGGHPRRVHRRRVFLSPSAADAGGTMRSWDRGRPGTHPTRITGETCRGSEYREEESGQAGISDTWWLASHVLKVPFHPTNCHAGEIEGVLRLSLIWGVPLIRVAYLHRVVSQIDDPGKRI